MVVCLIIGVFLLSCEKLKDEDLKITLNYDHKRQQEYPEANFRQYYQRPVLPQRHHINIKDFIQKNIYDETELNVSSFLVFAYSSQFLKISISLMVKCALNSS